MFTRIDDFAEEWLREMEMTAGVMDALTDESLRQRVAEGRRTLGQLAWHLVRSAHYMSNLGLRFDGPEGGEDAPASASYIGDEYRRISRSLLDAVKSQWTDADLLESQTIAGEAWPNGGSMRYALMHQAHHRGQMTVLMRQAGLRVPELYGPTYDSWIEKGLAPLV